MRSLPLVALLPLLVATCGDVSSSQMVARDKATSATCDWYQMCQQIGPNPNQRYTSRSSCEVDVRAAWETGWPPAECDRKINQTQLDVCINRIKSTDCTNVIDILATITVSCPKEKICSTAADGGGGQ